MRLRSSVVKRLLHPLEDRSNVHFTKASARAIIARIVQAAEESEILVPVALDTETVARTPSGSALVIGQAQVVVVSLSTVLPDDEEISIAIVLAPLSESVARRLEHREDLIHVSDLPEILEPLTRSRSIIKVFHNANYDITVLRGHGVRFRGPIDCTLLLSHAHDPNLPRGLKDRAPLVGCYLRKTSTVDFSNVADLSVYAIEDVVATRRLHHGYLFGKDISIGSDALKFYTVLDMPLQHVIIGMERTGIRINLGFLRKLEKQMVTEIEEAKARIYAANGGPFNIASVKQLRDFLFKKLRVTPHVFTGGSGEYSTNADQLRLSAHEHPVMEDLLRVRKIEKLLGTYVAADRGIPRYVDSFGTLHPTFNLAGTITGRMSSSHPNAQNIPSKKDEFHIRKAFVARKGHSLIVLDYSQMELRMMAVLAMEKNLIRVFGDPNEDVHARTAKACGVTRDVAKVINFGLLYGMGSQKLAYTLTLSGVVTDSGQAGQYISKFYSAWPDLESYRQALIAQHAKDGYIQYISGRHRSVPALLDPSIGGGFRAAGQRELWNNHDQGSCADWVRFAMLRISRSSELKKMGVRMLMQIHDELVLESPTKHAEEARAIAKRLMELPPDLLSPFYRKNGIPVHFEVTGGIGPNWKEAK